MTPFKKILLCSLLCLCVMLTGCTTGVGLPITDGTPEVTLPPADVSFVAPIGDAALEYSEQAVLYLPSHDGISLTPVTTHIAYSPVRPRAESLVRALLSYSGSKEASAVGGDVRLSLYGTSPVEVSGGVATINLSASALQLDRESLFITCQAIANTLTELDEVNAVNILVVDRAIGLDIANKLPLGALQHNPAQDLGAVYKQLLSRRVESTASSANKPFSANVTLYFPLNNTNGMVSEVRTMAFENQVLADMVRAILFELAAGPVQKDILSPPLPLLADLLTTEPVLVSSEQTGGSILVLDFAHNLVDMLDAYGITQSQCTASLCYTFCTFLPNVSGVQVSISGEPISNAGADGEQTAQTLIRSDFSELLYDYCTLYFINGETGLLEASRRPVPYYQSRNPRKLLTELSRGPMACDSMPQLKPVMHSALTDTDMLGFALSGQTLLVNFTPSFSGICKSMSGNEERHLAYAIVNTLCMNERIKSVCFFQSGNQFDGFSGDIYWAGLFYPLPY